MLLPVTAAADRRRLADAAATHCRPRRIRVSALVAAACWRRSGLLGSAFHAYGIQRNMGGWRNWSQNVLNGPPLPAPPGFTALALAGLAALALIERASR